jgi:hypothetical protein
MKGSRQEGFYGAGLEKETPAEESLQASEGFFCQGRRPDAWWQECCLRQPFARKSVCYSYLAFYYIKGF